MKTSITEAVRQALRERLEREKAARVDEKRFVSRLLAIAEQIASAPDLDARTPEEILA